MSDPNVAEVFSRPNTEARIHDLENFTLWTDTPDRPNYRSRLSFGERNGVPRVTLFPNLEGGPVAVGAGIEPVMFYEFLKRFETIVNGENGKADYVTNMGAGPNAERGKPPKEADLVIRNILHFGKSQEGVCWLALEQAGVKNIRFMVVPTMYHYFSTPDGQPLSKAAASVNYTRALIECLRLAMGRWIARIRPLSDKAAGRAGSEGGAVGGNPSSISTFDGDVRF